METLKPEGLKDVMSMQAEQTLSDWPGAGGLSAAERAAIETLYRAFNTGDAGLLDRALAQDWLDIPLGPGQPPGRDGLKPMVQAFRAAFAEVRFTPQEVTGSNGRAAVRLTLTGRHVGEWMGVAPTGREFEIAMHEMHHFADGRITQTWHLEDWAGWREQVGVA